ncbi:MAG: F0F1 ATP synthase subunit B [Zetaproteobacteria bacterium]|nr:MAG: F0F1 ATP synthase subunit B [Zetaproteobacteria bacterium]
MSLNLTFVAQVIVFLAMIWVLKRLLYQPLTELMQARAKKIEEGLAAAEAGLAARQKAEEEVARQLEEARAKAHEIIAAAERRSQEILEEAREKARAEADGILESAREEIRAEVERARAALKGEVAEIALLAAEKIVAAELDAKRHKKLVDELIEKAWQGGDA